MRILITNDDGRHSFGLALLREAARKRFKEARIITITTEEKQLGRGMSVKGESGLVVKEAEQDFFVMEGYPADIAYEAFCNAQKYLSAGTFDLVLSGVNEGSNVGLDVLHSGTVGAAMMASAIFGCTAYAFSQQLVQGKEGTLEHGSAKEKEAFDISSKYLSRFMVDMVLETGECFNVNFPLKTPIATAFVKTAPYSRWRIIPSQASIRYVDKLNLDIAKLNAGYITIAELDLQLNPPLRY